MTTRTVEELQALHSEMLAQAVDLGMEVPQDLQLEFQTAEVGETTVSSLEKLLRKFREGLNVEDDKSSSASAPETEAPTETKKTVKSTKKSAKKAAKKTTAAKATAKKTETKAEKSAKAETKPTPKKSAKKSVKSAKKNGVAAKAETKGTDAPKNGAARKTRGYDESAKIIILVKDPPVLAKKTKWAVRLQRIYDAAGKRVADFGGSTADISSAIKKGLIRVG